MSIFTPGPLKVDNKSFLGSRFFIRKLAMMIMLIRVKKQPPMKPTLKVFQLVSFMINWVLASIIDLFKFFSTSLTLDVMLRKCAFWTVCLHLSLKLQHLLRLLSMLFCTSVNRLSLLLNFLHDYTKVSQSVLD